MTITLNIPERDEAEAVRSLVEDMRGLIMMRLKRPNITAARIVGAGKILNVFDEIEQQLPASESETATEGQLVTAALQA